MSGIFGTEFEQAPSYNCLKPLDMALGSRHSFGSCTQLESPTFEQPRKPRPTSLHYSNLLESDMTRLPGSYRDLDSKSDTTSSPSPGASIWSSSSNISMGESIDGLRDDDIQDDQDDQEDTPLRPRFIDAHYVCLAEGKSENNLRCSVPALKGETSCGATPTLNFKLLSPLRVDSLVDSSSGSLLQSAHSLPLSQTSSPRTIIRPTSRIQRLVRGVLDNSKMSVDNSLMGMDCTSNEDGKLHHYPVRVILEDEDDETREAGQVENQDICSSPVPQSDSDISVETLNQDMEPPEITDQRATGLSPLVQSTNNCIKYVRSHLSNGNITVDEASEQMADLRAIVLSSQKDDPDPDVTKATSIVGTTPSCSGSASRSAAEFSPDSADDRSWNSVLLSMIDESMEQLIHSTMSDFYDTYALPSDGGDSSSRGTASFASGVSTGPEKAKRIIPQKRRRQSMNEEEDERDNVPNERCRKRVRGRPPRFACPFFKKNPRKYANGQACSGPGWPDVHRVKEHIHRCHSQYQTTRCPRCHERFADLIRHLSLSSRCEEATNTDDQDEDEPEGITSIQAAALHRRAARDQTDVEKWKAIFRIVFPNVEESQIPSPFYEYDTVSRSVTSPASDAVSQINETMRRELPVLFRLSLESVVRAESQAMQERIERRIPDMVRNAQEHVFANVRRSLETSTPSETITSASLPYRPPIDNLQRQHVANFLPPLPASGLQNPTIEDIEKLSDDPDNHVAPPDSGYYTHNSADQIAPQMHPNDSFSSSILPTQNPQNDASMQYLDPGTFSIDNITDFYLQGIPFETMPHDNNNLSTYPDGSSSQQVSQQRRQQWPHSHSPYQNNQER